MTAFQLFKAMPEGCELRTWKRGKVVHWIVVKYASIERTSDYIVVSGIGLSQLKKWAKNLGEKP